MDHLPADIAKYTALLKENERLDNEIAQLQAQGVTTDLQPQIRALHAYNEIKDLAQLVLGHLANAEGTSVAELHGRYNLPLD